MQQGTSTWSNNPPMVTTTNTRLRSRISSTPVFLLGQRLGPGMMDLTASGTGWLQSLVATPHHHRLQEQNGILASLTISSHLEIGLLLFILLRELYIVLTYAHNIVILMKAVWATSGATMAIQFRLALYFHSLPLTLMEVLFGIAG